MLKIISGLKIVFQKPAPETLSTNPITGSTMGYRRLQEKKNFLTSVEGYSIKILMQPLKLLKAIWTNLRPMLKGKDEKILP